MSKYRKKPVVVEAFKLDTKLVDEAWFWDAVSEDIIILHGWDNDKHLAGWLYDKWYVNPIWCEIKTLEGTMIARMGDYIVKGINGEIYPVKADIFDKTYEPIE